MATINILRFHLMILSSLFLGADGYYYYQVKSCVFSSYDLSDIEFIDTHYFNKDPFMRFSTNVGKFVGFTEYGITNAERMNNDPYILAQERAELDRYCKPTAQNEIKSILTKSVEPKVKLRSEQKASGAHPASLMCSVYDFYPPTISVSWLRDGKPVTTDVITTDVMANGDWYYQVHTILEYTPKFGEKISCVVEHASFKEPQIYEWHGSQQSLQ